MLLLPTYITRPYRISRQLVIGLLIGASLSAASTAIAYFVRQRWKRRLTSKTPWEPIQLHKSAKDKRVVDGVTGLIGNTPLVRIKSLSKLTGCEIFGKAEFMNPGGSVKDRVSLQIVNNAEKRGLLFPNTGSTIFEGTSGSTGISISYVSRAKGYNAHIVLSDDVSQDKVKVLESLGTTVERVRPVSIVSKEHYVHMARQRAMAFGKDHKVLEERESNSDSSSNRDPSVLVSEQEDFSDSHPEHLPRGFFADQFENLDNFQAHYEGTGPEIWDQVSGQVDAFVSGAGTGGTISGVGQYLKSQDPNVRIVLADPNGSGLYNKVKYGVMYAKEEQEGKRRRHQVDSIIEGIGLNRTTNNVSKGMDIIDDAYRVTDQEAAWMSRYLMQHEGLFLGSSSAVNLVACIKLSRKLPKNSTIVTILCDHGSRHYSRFWNDQVLDNLGIDSTIEPEFMSHFR